MKMMSNKYVELKKRHQSEINNFPIGFAFNKQQLAEGLVKLGLEPTDTDKVYSIGGGGFIRKTDSDALFEMFTRHKDEFKAAVEADKDGTGFVYQMFRNELANHEYAYTYELDDTLDAVGFSYEEVQGNPALKNGLELALKAYEGD